MTEDIELFEEYVQKNKSYYTGKLKKYNSGQRFSFNVFAFFFGAFWFLYRKMYVEAILIVIALILEGFLESIILTNKIGQDQSTIVNMLGTITLWTIIGFLGNYFYLRKADKTILFAKQNYPDNELLKKYLKEKGGVRFVFLLVIIIVIISFFVYNNYLTINGN